MVKIRNVPPPSLIQQQEGILKIRKAEPPIPIVRHNKGKWADVLDRFLSSGLDSVEVYPDRPGHNCFSKHEADLARNGLRSAVKRYGAAGVSVVKSGNGVFLTKVRREG